MYLHILKFNNHFINIQKSFFQTEKWLSWTHSCAKKALRSKIVGKTSADKEKRMSYLFITKIAWWRLLDEQLPENNRIVM